MDQTAEYIRGLAGVAEVSVEGVTSISIEYESGLRGGLFLNQTGSTGDDITRSGGAPVALAPAPQWVSSGPDTIVRSKTVKIPLHLQTVGSLGTDWASPLAVAPMLTAGTSDVILNRKVLIYAPYEAVWAPYNEGPALVSLFDASPLGLAVTYLQNQDATVEALQSLTSYGLVILATHGSQGIAFATGEIASASKKEEYEALREDGQIGVWTNVQVDETGAGLAVSDDVFVIYDSFIDNLQGSFPASLIVNNSCESTQSDALWRAFEAKGAEAYFGYSRVVSSSFAVDKVLELIEPMVSSELATTGDAFVAGQIDPSGQPAEFQMRGNEELHYGTTLVNGDFEFGNLDGWTTSGDGRVISQLGTESADQGNFMGIISTGLGFTETSGEISQLFRVDASTSTMTLRWNFLSEEFLEFVGTEFQDFFRIVIEGPSGSATVFEKSIDDINAQYPLTLVSPAIVFDQGDIYGTGWLDLTLDLSAYQGDLVTVRFQASDFGDSIYDTVILLDQIAIN